MSESSSKTTTDLKTIQKWAEESDVKPTRVKSTVDKKVADFYESISPATRVKIL